MEQSKALALLQSGRNLFLTGSAGTGKTWVLNQYIAWLKQRNIPVACTASTGIAATHMKGVTIHSWSGIGINDRLTEAQIARLKRKKALRKTVQNTRVLIIDEISMLHKDQIELIDRVMRQLRSNVEAFGGLQLVLCGDFFQLPPVSKVRQASRDRFAFMSQTWLDTGLSVCYLSRQYRQDDDQLSLILNEIRSGEISEITERLLLRLQQNSNTASQSPDAETTRLYTHNADVNRMNQQRLKNLPGKPCLFEATMGGRKSLVETLKKSILAEETLALKKQAMVMFIKNEPELGVVNGTLGQVVDFDEAGLPQIKTSDGVLVTATRSQWSIEDEKGTELATFHQIPLRLAWAITVHKCQGMTLDSAHIDLSKTFERGQGYVALSRLRDIDRLRLTGFNQTALEVDPLALKADIRFRALSEECDVRFTMAELEEASVAFVKRSGGLLEPVDRKGRQNKIKKNKATHKSTYDITLDFVNRDLSLAEIAQARGLSKGTIIKHLEKLYQKEGDADLSRYRPSLDIVKRVAEAKRELLKELDSTQVGRKSLFEKLRGQISYRDIRLAQLFLD